MSAEERRQWMDDVMASDLPITEKAFCANIIGSVRNIRPGPSKEEREAEHHDRMRRAARFQGKERRTRDDDFLKMTDDRFIRIGGMRTIEEEVAKAAVKEAIRHEQQFWLPQLERWLKLYDGEGDTIEGDYLRAEVKRLRRILKRKTPIAERRAKNKARVKNFRARQAQEAQEEAAAKQAIIDCLKLFVSERRNDVSAEAIAEAVKVRATQLRHQFGRGHKLATCHHSKRVRRPRRSRLHPQPRCHHRHRAAVAHGLQSCPAAPKLCDSGPRGHSAQAIGV
jgi:hypothetical protein